jgi:hypothetical protein
MMAHRSNSLSANLSTHSDSWATFQKKMGKIVEEPKNTIRNNLDDLTMPQLKFLASKYNVKPKGRVEERFFEDRKLPPSKRQYINALSKVVNESDIELAKRTVVEKPVVKKKKRSSSSSWFW